MCDILVTWFLDSGSELDIHLVGFGANMMCMM